MAYRLIDSLVSLMARDFHYFSCLSKAYYRNTSSNKKYTAISFFRKPIFRDDESGSFVRANPCFSSFLFIEWVVKEITKFHNANRKQNVDSKVYSNIPHVYAINLSRGETSDRTVKFSIRDR